MSETADKRIMQVANELNVSWTHLIDSLNKAGFKLDSKPTVKITAEMYSVLLKEYASDKQNKAQANKINLGSKTTSPEKPVEKPEVIVTKRAKDESEVLVKNLPNKVPVTEVKPVAKPKEETTVIRAKTEKIAGPKVVGKIEVDVPKPVAEEESKTKGRKKKEEAPDAEEKKEEIKTEAPKTKGRKKKEEPAVEEIKTPEPPAEISSTEIQTPPTETAPTEFRKTEYTQLSGPKILGKVDLSTIKAPEPEKKKREDQQGKRKRIYPVEKPKTAAEQIRNRPIEKARPDFNKSKRPIEKRKDEIAEVSEKEVQEKIKETMARISAKTGKSSKSKYRRLKREEHAENANVNAGETTKLQVTEFVSVAELASLLNIGVTEVIKNCMNLGIIVSINQRLDATIIELVAHEFGHEVEFISLEQQTEFDADEVDDPEELETRPPIVTIMGHVDHGKTSLLDYIRNTTVVAGEKGGITQHIGAYEVELASGRKITFLDTPGHEAFTAMRARGAKVTDIAVIVIAADDSVMPQTREAISHAQAAQVPMIFAFNKMDKPGANADKIREQLSSMNILLEEWGGKFQSQEISAKAGTNVDTLLDKILLEADLLELKANPNKAAVGSVIEATLDKGRGYATTLLVQEGTLEVGELLLAGSNFGRVKAMFNERGQKVKTAGPSTPVLILGLDGAPTAGEKFKIYFDEAEAKELATRRKQLQREQGIRTKKHITLDEIGRRLALGNFKELNVIVKADFDGSVEALTDSLLKLSTPEIQVNVVHKAVGQITESDVLLASASDAIIIGFQVRPSSGARQLAEKENIDLRLYSIIYNAIEELKSAMEGMLEPKIEEKIVCNVEVREVFKITKVGTVAGCMVTEGKIQRATKVRLIREGIVVYSGEILALKRFKDDVKEVTTGQDCGISIKNYNDVKVGDVIEGYEETEVKRTL